MRVIAPSNRNGLEPLKALGRATCGTLPADALKPYTPLQDDGMRMEPPPSVPCASGSSPSATAPALPPEEPPVLRVVSKGLRDGPKR